MRTLLVGSDDALDAALEASAAAGLPEIAVSANQSKFLYLLARLQGSRRVSEIGTLGGYSTIWLARALPADGEVITVEVAFADLQECVETAARKHPLVREGVRRRRAR